MGKSAPSPPPPPDPKAVASAQTATNIQTALANAYMGNANEQNPYGNVDYTISGYTPITDSNGGATYQVPTFNRNVTLSPAEQQKLDLNNQTALGLDQLANTQTTRLSNLLSSPITDQSLSPNRINSIAPVNYQMDAGDPNKYTQDAANVQSAIMSRVAPEMDRQRAALETNLVNQGYQRGSSSFNTQMDQFNRQNNDANQQAVLAGYQEQQNLANLALQQGQFHNAASTDALNAEAQTANFQNNARQQSLQEQLALRNQPINEVSALMSGGQVTLPQFQGYQFSPMTPAPVGQYTYQSANLAQQNYQSQLQSYNAGLSGMYGLGSSLLGGMFMMSDRRLKKNIVELGIRLRDGAKLYAYEYLHSAKRHVGVMADEIVNIRPQAVRLVGEFLAVDYGELF